MKEFIHTVLTTLVSTVIVFSSTLNTSQSANAKQININSDNANSHLIAQSCGNIELREGDIYKGQKWDVCGYIYAFQDDGNFVIYTQSGQAIWATGTEGHGARLAVQGDGNVVIYNDGGQAIWATNTNGNYGAFLALQEDGNLVVYSQGSPLYATNTTGGQQKTFSAAREWGWNPGNVSSGQSSDRNSSQSRINDFVSRFNGVENIARLDTSAYSGECVSLVARYLQEEYFGGSGKSLWLNNGGGTADAVASNHSNHFGSISDPSDPIAGAVISFPGIGGGYGHVALVTGATRINQQEIQIDIIDSNSGGETLQNLTATVQTHTLVMNTNNFSAPSYGSGIRWTNPRD
jgi:CHAP domain